MATSARASGPVRRPSQWPNAGTETQADEAEQPDETVTVIKLSGLKLVSPNRLRGNTRGAAISETRRKRDQRDIGKLQVRAVVSPFTTSCVKSGVSKAEITIVRITPKAYDDDNYIAACKALRDGIADAFMVKDNDPNIEFWYEQRRNQRPHQCDVHIEIRMRAPSK